ncbi:hypothetical protein AB0H77_15580 [Streptomyces sp. NPDC050844]|uniref:hypothetical protein n=1 Tax=Streptomyces sp. NPDC050844 TaxID=3155790 RepID=UPI0033E9EBF6
MSRLARTLCSLHGLLGIWLAYCTVQQFRYGEAWAAIVFAAASIVPVISVVRESELADEQQAEAIRAETEARRLAWADEDAAALARAELAAACCELWWTSTGEDHEATCPKNDHRSAA